MSEMMAEPLPSTLMDFSSTVGLSPDIVISLVPGCDAVSPRPRAFQEGITEVEVAELAAQRSGHL